MKKNMMLFVLILLLLQSCISEESTTLTPVDEELQAYIDTFVEEAESRGLIIDIESENFTAQIALITDRGTVGQCRVYSDGSQEVVIHSPYWNNINELDKEYIVFHELGHCLLGRDHNDESDTAGNCISIMQNGDDTCNKRYNQENRTVLIDELFFN